MGPNRAKPLEWLQLSDLDPNLAKVPVHADDMKRSIATNEVCCIWITMVCKQQGYCRAFTVPAIEWNWDQRVFQGRGQGWDNKYGISIGLGVSLFLRRTSRDEGLALPHMAVSSGS